MFQPIDEPRARFERVFPSRVRELREAVRRLGNCLNRQNYRYSTQEFLVGLDQIQQELDFLRGKALNGGRRV